MQVQVEWQRLLILVSALAKWGIRTMFSVRNYIIATVCGFIVTLFSFLVSATTRMVFENPDSEHTLSVASFFSYALYVIHENWGFLILAFLIATVVIAALLSVIILADYWMSERSLRKFDSLLYSSVELQETSRNLLRTTRNFVDDKPEKTSEAFATDRMTDAFIDAMWDLIKMFPATYKGEPSCITCSLMVMDSFLNDQDTYKNDIKEDQLRIIYYVDDDKRSPFLPQKLRVHSLSKKPLSFAARAALSGDIQMSVISWWRGLLNPSKRFVPLRRLASQQNTGDKSSVWAFFRNWLNLDFDSGFHNAKGKKSIVCIPLTDKKNNIIGVLDIDSSLKLLSGNWRVSRHFKRVIAIYIANFEDSMVNVKSKNKNSMKKDVYREK